MPDSWIVNLQDTIDAFDGGALTAEQAVTEALARIADPHGQGAVAFLEVSTEAALDRARAWDEHRARGEGVPPLAGVPFSVKDNIDQVGIVTRAASPVLAGMPPAASDAPFLRRLLDLGAVPVGRTNMTAFAYSGLGLNPHFGTPLSPLGRDIGLIAGGSTSGGAVSVAEGMAAFAIGTDTSGSCRIPAACCGLVGYRPTKTRHSIDGIVPLAPSYDVPGFLASDVAGIRILAAAMAGRPPVTRAGDTARAPRLTGLRFLVPTDDQLASTDPPIERHFATTIARIEAAGASVERAPFLFDAVAAIGPWEIFAHEALWLHEPLLAAHRALYDPRIARRVDLAARITDGEYTERLAALDAVMAESDRRLSEFDAVLTPTLPVVPPTLAQLRDDDDYFRYNSLIIRNTAIANHLDLPAIAVPMGLVTEARLPASLQVIGRRDEDEAMIDVAAALAPIANEDAGLD